MRKFFSSFKVKRLKRVSGFTLLEILIALILFTGAIAALSRVLVAGKYHLKEAESKSTLMKVASLQMEKYLSYSYTGLEDLGGYSAAAEPVRIIPQGALVNDTSTWQYDASDPRFRYRVTLTKKNETRAAAGGLPAKTVPYIEILVQARHIRTDIAKEAGESDLTEEVRLINIVPYPYYHVYSLKQSWGANLGPVALQELNYASGSNFMSTPATIFINNRMESNLLIFYSLNIESAGALAATDVVRTQCFLEVTPSVPPACPTCTALSPMTETNFPTQPWVSNVIGYSTALSPVASGGLPHRIDLRWNTNSWATVGLRNLEFIVVAIDVP